MKKKLLAIFALSSLLLFAGCSATHAATTGGYQKISAAQAKEKIDAGNVTIVDVRTSEEFAERHIKNAVLVPSESIGETPPEALAATDATLLVYCRTGRRSKIAAEKLLALGYQTVFDFGGIEDWSFETVPAATP